MTSPRSKEKTILDSFNSQSVKMLTSPKNMENHHLISVKYNYIAVRKIVMLRCKDIFLSKLEKMIDDIQLKME